VNTPDKAGVQTSEAELNAAIARAVVRIRQRYVGRGPAKATAFFRRHFVVVVMEDTMTQAEHSLALDGKSETVRKMNLDLNSAMESDLRAMIEGLTGCRVTAFLSAGSIEPDISCHVYSLDRNVQVRVDEASADAAQVTLEEADPLEVVPPSKA
jgi:uncharacterized protein YbcI